jgi:hypothetical protein
MSATDHVEADALAALRAELLHAAGRDRSRRRRNRRLLVAAAVVVSMLAATAATAALTDFSTGVPVVDELVGIESPPPVPGGPAVGDRRPALGSGTEPLDVPIGDGVYKTVAYLSRDGGVCIVSAERHRGGVRGGFGGCPSLAYVNRRVERRAGLWMGGSNGVDERTTQPLVDGRVRSVRPLGPGDWRVLMTDPWTPKAPGAHPLRLVVVIDDADITEEELMVARLAPALKLTYRDGHARVLRGP